jgi:hypothetical protein
MTLVDPLAWYYYHTGREEYKDIIIQFQDTGVPGWNGTAPVPGNKPYYNFRSIWNGDHVRKMLVQILNCK